MSSHREAHAEARRRAKEKEARLRREEERLRREEEDRLRREEEDEEEEEALRREENYIRMLSMYYKEVMKDLPDMTESELTALVKGLPREWVADYLKTNGRRNTWRERVSRHGHPSRRRPVRTKSWPASLWSGGTRTRKQRG